MSIFYAVKSGKMPGIYSSWEDCKNQVTGYSKAAFKKFKTEADAIKYLTENDNKINAAEEIIVLPPESLNKPASMSKLGNLNDMKSKNALSTIRVKNIPQMDLTSQMTANNIDHRPCMAKIEELKDEIKQLREAVTKLQNESTSSRRKAENDIGNENKKFKLNTEVDGDGTGTIHVYTDGACTKNGRNGAKAGIGVYFGENHTLNLSERLPGRPTNNRAEIHAAIRAVEQVKKLPRKPSKVVIYTDSQFLIKSITMWIKKWKRNGWKLNTGSNVINKEDFEELELVKQGLNIEWVHVKGHAGIKGNEEADRLAVESLKKPDV